ncbi:ribonuclease domain-containing protein [Epilithonimonas lactis]|uniref:Ribonuclease n=1 Tax=Epilithonimonas lactis TaxID=421072 RepID=A0A085BIF1_9FLAO|nr:ribonuclease domain-containing protein [Epilithonimonas lactis]KFC22246.1 ribonuclease N [Epilithonimonas lactis]SEQ59273.1 ribonuclease [Epilithonimonas lactis]
MNPKLKTLLFFLVGAFAGISVMFLITNYKIEKRNKYLAEGGSRKSEVAKSESQTHRESNSENSIEELTNESKVISYVKSNHKLPDYYLTKSEAKNRGWIASKGNLCDVLPGKAIGGDKFSNREKQLPRGEQYYEADVNYNCGNRGADRIVFTENGDVWLTKNHYKSFEKK